MDFIFGFPKDSNGNNGILVFVDRFSKMVHLVAVSDNISAEESAKIFLDTIFRLHGMPNEIISDRDPRFTAKFYKFVFKLLGTRLSMSTADHPETDGQTERVNRVLEDILRSFATSFSKSWSSQLPMAEFAINNSVHTSTGHSPFFVNTLRHPRVPSLLTGQTPILTGGETHEDSSSVSKTNGNTLEDQSSVSKYLQKNNLKDPSFKSPITNDNHLVEDSQNQSRLREQFPKDSTLNRNRSNFNEGSVIGSYKETFSKRTVGKIENKKTVKKVTNKDRDISSFSEDEEETSIQIQDWMIDHPTRADRLQKRNLRKQETSKTNQEHFNKIIGEKMKKKKTKKTSKVAISQQPDLGIKEVEDLLLQKQSVVRYVRDAIAEAVDKQKEQADKKGRKNKQKFIKGELVLLSTSNINEFAVTNLGSKKLLPRFIGPFKVLERIGDAYKLDIPSKMRM